LRLGYPEIKRRGGEVLEITATPPKLGTLYAKRFTLPFPYLCDGDYAIHRRYGLATRGMLAALRIGLESFPRELVGVVKGEQPSIFPYLPNGLGSFSMDQAMFLVGRDGRVRFRQIFDAHAHLPSNETLLRELDAVV